MTKKDFEAFAEYIKNLPVKQFGAGEREDMAIMVAEIASKSNPRFDKKQFFVTCELITLAKCLDNKI